MKARKLPPKSKTIDFIKVTYVSSEEGWCGLYFNDELQTEDHSLQTDDVLSLLVGHGVDELDCIHLDGKRNSHLEDVGNLPTKLSELLKWPE